MSKSSRSRGSFNKQHGKRAKALSKYVSQHLYHIHWSLANQFSWKKSLLLTCKILVLPVNTLTVDEKYPVPNRENLTIHIQMQLSQKEIFFYQFFTPFLKSRLNFEYFEKKDDHHWYCIYELTDSENVVRWMSKKCRFRGPFDKQHGKGAKELLKSTSQNIYHIH